jgi:inner membrane protein
MDILTQGIAGGLLAQVNAPDKEKRLATGIGFFAGVLADADILIRSADDPLVNLEFHRQFTHSLLFIPVGGLIAALLSWWLVRKHLSFSHTLLYGMLGYSVSGVLDACTSFGTQLLWPFLDTRIAWNIIAVVDPVFTLGILIMLIVGWKSRRQLPAVLGVCFAGLYLLLGWLQHEYAESLAVGLAQSRGHEIRRHVVKPTLGNIILWRSVYYADGYYYVDAIRTGFFAGDRVITGDKIKAMAPDAATLGLPEDSLQFRDVERFWDLSNGYLVMHPDDHTVLGDIRYSMLPDSVLPLWGIRIDRQNPHQHITEYLGRKNDKAHRDRFLKMLIGE